MEIDADVMEKAERAFEEICSEICCQEDHKGYDGYRCFFCCKSIAKQTDKCCLNCLKEIPLCIAKSIQEERNRK